MQPPGMPPGPQPMPPPMQGPPPQQGGPSAGPPGIPPVVQQAIDQAAAQTGLPLQLIERFVVFTINRLPPGQGEQAVVDFFSLGGDQQRQAVLAWAQSQGIAPPGQPPPG